MSDFSNPTDPMNPGDGVTPEAASTVSQPAHVAQAGYAAPAAASYEPVNYQQPSYVPPAYQQPMATPQVYVPQVVSLTGGQKFGWFVVGFLGNIVGMLLAWLVNIDKAPQVKSDAIKFAVIGFVVSIALYVILFAFMGVAVTATMASYVDMLDSMYY